MKKRIVSVLLVVMMMSASALADDWGFGLGSLTSLFSMEDEGNTYKAGEKAVIGDYEVTLINLMESKGSQYEKPGSGNVFVIAEFSIKNKSKEELTVSSIMCFSAKADDTVYSLSLEADTIAMTSGKIQFDMTIDPGKTGTGIVGYEIPKGWKQLRITVTPDFYGSDRATFVVDK